MGENVTLDELKTLHPGEASKILGDDHGTIVTVGGTFLHAAYEQHLTGFGPSEASVAHDTFCDLYTCNGATVPADGSIRLGHVISMNAFNRFIARPAPVSAVLPPRAGMLGPVPARPLASHDVNLVLLSHMGAEKLRSDGAPVWCFEPEGADGKPYTAVDETLLPCRLGLKQSKETEGPDVNWIGFEIEPPPTIWRKPTFADTTWAFLVDWMPGGLTISAPGNDCGPGLSEVIGTDLTYSQMRFGVGPFAAAWPVAPKV